MTEGPTIAMRPEFELLLCCAMRSHRRGCKRLRTLLEQRLDWQCLVRLANHHGMMPHLYARLSETCASFVPEAALTQLHEQFTANARRNLLLTAKLLKLLALFEEHQIAAVPFKGPLLALSAYGDSALRQFSDLDVLIHTEDVPKARELLISHGYCPQFSLTREQETDLIRFRNEHAFWHEVEGVAVDLHWALAPRWFQATLDTENVWNRVESTTVAGRIVATLSAEDMLLFLCVHGSKHCWHLLSMIYDLAAHLRASTMVDWQRLIDQADRQGSERMLLLGFHLASELFGVELPGELARKIKTDPSMDRLAAQVYRILLRDTDVAGGFFEEHLFNLRAIEYLRRKALYCFDQVLTPTPIEWASLPLPSSLSFLYYLVRPLRLVLKYKNGLPKPAFD